MTQYQPMPQGNYGRPQPKKSNTLKILLIIGGVFLGLIVCCCGGLIIWGVSQPEGGVRTASNMEDYATDYIKSEGLLDPGETIVVYYDESATMNGTMCAILTDKRLIYHTSGGNISMAAGDIVSVSSSEVILADKITVRDKKGMEISFEVFSTDNAPLFINALEDQIQRNGVPQPPF